MLNKPVPVDEYKEKVGADDIEELLKEEVESTSKICKVLQINYKSKLN